MIVIALSFGSAPAGSSGNSPAGQASDRFDVADVMIAARDGVKLHTKCFVPKGAADPLPFIFTRTPYGITGAASSFNGRFKELADDGYIFVFQNIRGRFRSEGSFVMQRPARNPKEPGAMDEGTDTYDTIEWLLKNVHPNNGGVGMLGVSYDGWTTAMATIEPHPALKAVSPQASPADMWMGDDFHHNGAFRLSYGFEYAAMMETSKESSNFAFDRYDTYQWYLALGPLVLETDVTIAGEITAHLFAGTTGSDADWIVKLIDVYPEQVKDNWKLSGWQLMVSNEVFRGRYRKGFEKPVPMVPGQVTPITFYMEETILDEPVIYFNGGARGFLVALAPADLVRVLEPVSVRVGIGSRATSFGKHR